MLWDHTVERIRERPWTGFGFGRGIIGDELRAALRDPLLAHAHNVFVSQWLQTGAPGFALLVAASRLSIFVPLEARARSGAAIQKKC